MNCPTRPLWSSTSSVKKNKQHKRLVRIAATIVVERDSHKAMVIGDKGERLKRIGTETRQELEKLMDAKVFIEIWVKVRSGWADDEARVRSFGYEYTPASFCVFPSGDATDGLVKPVPRWPGMAPGLAHGRLGIE